MEIEAGEALRLRISFPFLYVIPRSYIIPKFRVGRSSRGSLWRVCCARRPAPMTRRVGGARRRRFCSNRPLSIARGLCPDSAARMPRMSSASPTQHAALKFLHSAAMQPALIDVRETAFHARHGSSNERISAPIRRPKASRRPPRLDGAF